MGQRIARELEHDELKALLNEAVGGAIPALIDRRLMRAGTEASGGAPLTLEQKRRVRAACG